MSKNKLNFFSILIFILIITFHSFSNDFRDVYWGFGVDSMLAKEGSDYYDIAYLKDMTIVDEKGEEQKPKAKSNFFAYIYKRNIFNESADIFFIFEKEKKISSQFFNNLSPSTDFSSSLIGGLYLIPYSKEMENNLTKELVKNYGEPINKKILPSPIFDGFKKVKIDKKYLALIFFEDIYIFSRYGKGQSDTIIGQIISNSEDINSLKPYFLYFEKNYISGSGNSIYFFSELEVSAKDNKTEKYILIIYKEKKSVL